jgi:hypothetical protein
MSLSYPPSGGRPMQSCQRCGMSLPPNEVRCGNCGFSNVPGQGGNSFGGSPSNMPNGGPGPQAASNPGQFGGGTWRPPAGGPTSGAQWGGQPVNTSTASGLYTPPSIPQPVTPGTIPAQQMNNGTFQRPPATFSVNQPSANPPSMQRRDFLPRSGTVTLGTPISKTRVAMGMVVLIVLLLSGTIVGLTYFRKETAPKTNTVVPIPTPNVAPDFSDPFNDNTYGWNLQSQPGKYNVTVAAGNLTLEDDDHKLLWEQLPGQRSFSDFTMYVDATLSKGDQANGYGIYIRGTPNPSSDLATYYRFELYGDGGYAIYKGVIDNGNSGYTKLVDYTASTAVNKAGKVNHLRITAQGSTLSLMVNGYTLQTITDTSYSKGAIAFFVSNTTDAKAGAQVQFSNFGIYKVGA